MTSTVFGNYLRLIEDELFILLDGKQPPELYDPVAYILNLGGKRIRPVMLLTGNHIFGGNPVNALPAALAVEYFHNFTLIHDDIMDQAPVRRSQPTIHEKWNANIAILSGDTMFALAIQHLCKLEPHVQHQVLPVFLQTAIEVCEGQQYDMNFESAQNVSLEEYMEMIRLKTAVLVGASLQIGAITAGASDEDIQNIRDFGENVGIAFQIKDDWLDLYGDEKKFGKMKGGDIVANKKTFLYLKACELANPAQKKELFELFSDPGIDPGQKVARVSAIFETLNIKSLGLAEAEKYYDKGLQILKKIRLKPEHADLLTSFTDQLMDRDR